MSATNSLPSVAVYRTAFPHASETFIAEQVRALRSYRPVMLVRTPRPGIDVYDHVALSTRARSLDSLLFTMFGRIGPIRHAHGLSGVRVVHAHFAPDALLALPIAEYLGVPLVATCHGSDVTVNDWGLVSGGRIADLRYLLQRSRLFSRANRFIAVSDFLKQRMIESGYPAQKVVRHYIGVDTKRFVPAREMSPQDERHSYVLSVARHSEVKGLDILIRAFARVADRHPALRLVQIGAGALTPQLKALVESLGLEQRVDFLGARPSRDVLRYIQGCCLLVLSSRKARNGAEESFGLVLAEAAACGIPTIGTRVGGIPEAVVDGQTGILVPPDDEMALAASMDGLLGNPDLALEMGRRAREWVCDCFDLERQTARLERIYDEVT